MTTTEYHDVQESQAGRTIHVTKPTTRENNRTVITDDTKTKILQHWKDPRIGITGLTRFHQKLKQMGIRVRMRELKQLLHDRPEHALFQMATGKQRALQRQGNEITEAGVGTGIQVDLMDMSMLATRNKNYAWILVAVDVFSRYAWAIPVKRKSQTAMKEAMQTLLGYMNTSLRRITSDQGNEFCNAQVQKLLHSHQPHPLTHFTAQVGDKTTTGIVERFIRTLRELMGKNFQRIGKLYWLEDLPKLMDNYNHSKHRTIQHTPYDVWHGHVTLEPSTPRRETFSYHEGDRVRAWLHKNIFDKRAGAQKWSAEVYTISHRDGFRYVLKNKHGEEMKIRYKAAHLQPVHVAQTATEEKDEQVVQQKKAEVTRARRKKAFLKRQGLLPATRFARFRPSRVRRRPRQR